MGGTATEADPENDTRPRLNRSGSPWTNCLAACLAASNRFGVTSVAPMDADTSNATMIVARSLGTRASAVGRAKPTTSSANISSSAAAGTCLRHQAAAAPPCRAGRGW